MEKQDLHFFLGGNDLEMKTIKDLLDKLGVAYSDKNISWKKAATVGVSVYGDEIEKIVKEGRTPVIIELKKDARLPKNTIEIDHHNENAGKPASILQVCELLGVEPTRKMQLIAANDSGYIPAMMEMGASKEEIAQIRYLDRVAQDITPEQEKQAEEAIAGAQEFCGVTVIKMPHSRTATVADRLFNPNKPQNLLIISGDGETNYYGPEDICRKLQGNKIGERPAPWDPNQTEVLYDHFGGWTGGDGLGKEGGTAFWGGYADQTKIAQFVLTENHEKQKEKANTSEMSVATLKFLKDFGMNK